MNKQNMLKTPQIPPRVGCYLFQDQQKRIIYVGKAKNLRQRIAHHFQESQSKYLGLIANCEIILTNNVKEALILEQNLIKKYQPRFNILLRDDHAYPYIKITEETNPRYWLTKKFNSGKKDLYFGPFPDGTKAAEVLQILEKVFPLAKCKGNLGKPCLDYSLGQCSGHCFKKVEPEYYQKTKQKIIDFFHGKTQIVKKNLQKVLRKSILNQEFELAKKEKKILDNLNFFTSEQNVDTTKVQTFPLQARLNEEKELLQSYLYQFYQKNLPPQILYLPRKLENQELLAEEFGFTCQIPQREELGKYLQIEPPYFLEVLDISNLFQQDIVAGFLVYVNGEKVKNRAKIYQLTGLEQKIDGGKLQVKAVLSVCRELALNIPVVGLAKNEKHQTEKIITSKFQELPLPVHAALQNFLVKLQAEVHHFVINCHRKLHRETVLK
ncbi:2094_t:CDS:2 [Entrophospora sp. SA101]|nr:2094_t:CDS:2 [Entrophospora sp. SA101]CAJ0916977.1 161_t:CDS:2 [Entrophospora sp. SA101]